MLNLILAATIIHSSKNPFVDVRARLRSAGFSQTEISGFFSDRRLKIYTQKAIATKKVNWKKYQTQILQKASVESGVSFIQDHQASFDAASSTYGVPGETIAAVMRIETDFGSNTGNYIVPDVFYSFLYHRTKVSWAEDNLVDYLIYAKREKIDPFTLKGSYAGAIGYPQFLPSSILASGVDGDADGKVNLNDVADAVPSLAHFLMQHGYAKSPLKALTAYYGSSIGYPAAALKYAAALDRAGG